MVDRLLAGLVVAREHGLGQRADVEDEGDRETILGGARPVRLVELVVEDEELLVVAVEHPALVRVRRAGVRGARDDRGRVLVGDVVDGECVFVVAVADVPTGVAGIGTAVDEALRAGGSGVGEFNTERAMGGGMLGTYSCT